MDFPLSVDFEVYRNHPDNQDLSHLFETELYSHYNNHGKMEGRTACYITSLESFLEIIKINKFSTFQICNAEKSIIPNFVVDLASVYQYPKKLCLINKDKKEIKTNKKYQAILSINSLQNQLDIISYLKIVSDHLDDKGYFFGSLPDKRYNEYHFVNETEISEVLGNHEESSKIPTLKTVVKANSYLTHNDAKRHWLKDHGYPKILENTYVVQRSITDS